MEQKGRKGRGFFGCLVVYEVDESHTEDIIREEVSKHGKVLYVGINMNKSQQKMAFVNMETKRDCAAVIVALHQQPPYNWTIRLNQPAEVREHRRLARQDRTHEASPEIQAKVTEFDQYESDINDLIRQMSDSLQVSGERPGAVGGATFGATAGAADGVNGGIGAHAASRSRPVAPRPVRSAVPSAQSQTQTQVQPQDGVVYEARLQGRAKRPCSVCGTPTVGHCKRCKTRYCSRDCQLSDWDLHSLDCREPEPPSFVTAAGDGPAVRGPPAAAAARPSDGYQSEMEFGGPSPRGRGAQRGRSYRGGGDADRYCETDVDDGSPRQGAGRRGRRQGRSPTQSSVASAIRPLEAPAQPVLSHLVRQSVQQGAVPRTPPRGPSGRDSLLGSPPGSVAGAGPARSLLGSPPASVAGGQRKPLLTSPPGSVTGGGQGSSLLGAPPAAMKGALRARSPAAAQALSPPAAPAAPAAPPTPVYAVTLEPGSTHEMVVALVGDPSTVYLRLQSKLADTDRMELELQSAAESGRGQPPPAVGHLCCGRFENAWYRGEVVSFSGGQYQIHFVDWGNTERLSASEVLPLPARFTGWPRQAVRARLDWQPAGGDQWSAAQSAAAAKLLQRMVVVRVTGRRQGEVTVSLTDPEGRNLLSPPAQPAAAAASPAAAPTPAAAPAPVPAPAPAPVPTPAPAPTPASAPRTAAPVPVAARPSGSVSLADRLPDNLTPMLNGDPLELGPSVPLEHPQEMALVLLDEEYLNLDNDLRNLPAEPTTSAKTGDMVVAGDADTPQRALVCGTGPNGYRLLFVDEGSVLVSKGPVRPLPAAWTVDKFRPLALYVRLADSAPAGTREALLSEENRIAVKVQPPARGGDLVVGHATTVTGVSVAVTVGSCRALLGQLGGAAPAPAPAPEQPAAGPVTVQYARLESGRQHVVLPCSMEHPQRVSAQLQDTLHYRPYLQMADRLKDVCGNGCAPRLVPPVGSLVGLFCDAVGSPAAWRRALVLESHGEQLRLRLVDWAVTVPAQLADVRPLDASFAQEKAIGVEFGLDGIAADACPESELGFYRNKLVNLQYLLELKGEKNGVPQATLNLLSEQRSFCFNEKMLSRLATAAAGATASSATPPALLITDLPKLNLKPGSTIPFFVTEVLSAANVYGTPLTDEAVTATSELEALLPELGGRAPPLAHPQTEQLLLAPDAETDGWSRGTLLAVDAGNASVWLLDHGRLVEVPATGLRMLHPDLARYPACAVELCLAGYDSLSEANAEFVQKKLIQATEVPLEVEIIGPTDEGFSARAPAIDGALRDAGVAL
ncbi:Tudor domain-containing protein 1 [Amphibalanus amphitrite]|uniref:Tudor domain-containing protein 1 n=1 Tax=Amphibalanus amphitrite TaxID=1232801 RepID=A0A6A4W656_AMPAM|nr:Tudor domain-containing protein 1 [Amphibalanus amphitrite]